MWVQKFASPFGGTCFFFFKPSWTSSICWKLVLVLSSKHWCEICSRRTGRRVKIIMIFTSPRCFMIVGKELLWRQSTLSIWAKSIQMQTTQTNARFRKPACTEVTRNCSIDPRFRKDPLMGKQTSDYEAPKWYNRRAFSLLRIQFLTMNHDNSYSCPGAKGAKLAMLCGWEGWHIVNHRHLWACVCRRGWIMLSSESRCPEIQHEKRFWKVAEVGFMCLGGSTFALLSPGGRCCVKASLYSCIDAFTGWSIYTCMQGVHVLEAVL